MNISIKIIKTQAIKLIKKAQGYAGFVFIVAMLGTYGFLIFQIGALSGKEPDDTAVVEQLNTLKRLKIDQSTIDKIEQLQDQNVPVQSLFKEARDNPFQDN